MLRWLRDWLNDERVRRVMASAKACGDEGERHALVARMAEASQPIAAACTLTDVSTIELVKAIRELQAKMPPVPLPRARLWMPSLPDLSGPITIEDEFTPYSPAFTSDTVADVKRRVQGNVVRGTLPVPGNGRDGLG